VKLWAAVEKAAINAIRTNAEQFVHRGIRVNHKWGMLLIALPSSRTICYPRARVTTEYDDGFRGDHDSIEYEGVNQTTKKWGPMRTYGGKLTENIVQSIARDILGVIILRACEKGYNIVFHIHDEIVVEAHGWETLQAIEAMFSEPVPWCPDLPLKGAGYTTPYYLKD
jgi:DNA polymerase